jgi:hypothetical protein
VAPLGATVGVAVTPGVTVPGAPVGGEPGVGVITTPGGVGVTATAGALVLVAPGVGATVPPPDGT